MTPSVLSFKAVSDKIVSDLIVVSRGGRLCLVVEER